jgi:hypothetical protein
LDVFQTLTDPLTQSGEALPQKLAGLATGLWGCQQTDADTKECRQEQGSRSGASPATASRRPGIDLIVDPALLVDHETSDRRPAGGEP